MSAAETETRSIWCCLCCAKPSADTLEESQRLLRDGQDQTVRKQPAKSSYGASDSHPNGTQPDRPKPTESHTQRDETQINAQDVRVDVVPNKDPDTPDNSETSSQQRPDVVPSDEGHPLQTEDADVSGNAAAAAAKSDIPPQAYSPLVDTSSANISETPSKQPDSKLEATNVIQQSPHSEEKASVETTATDGSSTEAAAAAAEKPQDDAQPSGKPDEQPKMPDSINEQEFMPDSTKDQASEHDSTKEPAPMPDSSTESEGDVQQSPSPQSDGQPAPLKSGSLQPASLGSFSMLADQGDAKDDVAPEQAQGSLEPVAEEHKVETSQDADIKPVEGTTPTGTSISTDSPPAPDSVTVADTVTSGAEDQAGKEAEDAASSEIPATPTTDSVRTDDGEPNAEGETQPEKSEDSQDDAKPNNDDHTASDAARSEDKPTADTAATTEAADKPQEPTGS